MRILATVILAAAAPAAAAVVAAPGYSVRSIPTPDVVQGGVVEARGALFVGQGMPGGVSEYVIRLDPGGATVVATEFNALGGFDLLPNGDLFMVDHGRGLPGSVTGDTIFELGRAFTRAGPTSALGLETLPAGSVPFARDILQVPEVAFATAGGAPGAGRVLRLLNEGEGGAEVLIDGLDSVGGLAFGTGGRLLVVNFDASAVGSILEYDYFGFPHGVFMNGLSASAAAAFDRDDITVLVTGLSAPDGSGMLVAVAADGTMTERARGLGTVLDLFFDAGRDELLVLEAGAYAVTAICSDGDADGSCNIDDPCTMSATLTEARLSAAGLGQPAGNERLRFSGRTVTSGPFDPVQSGVRLRLEGGAGVALDTLIPGGSFTRRTRSGWKVGRGGRTWTFRGRLEGLGLVRIRMSLAADGRELGFSVRARDAFVALAPASLPLRAILGLAPGALEAPCGVAPLDCRFRRHGRVLSCA